MNLKIIIQLPERRKNDLDKISNDLYDDFKGSYTEKEDFYITLRSINGIDGFTLKQIKSALLNVSGKSDPFILYCNELFLLNPRRKSSLVFSLRGLTSKLYNLHQNIENVLFTRGIPRDASMPFPYIEIAKKVAYKQLPYVKSPQSPINVGSIDLIEEHRKFSKLEHRSISEFPLFGGHLLVERIDEDSVVCQNASGKKVTLDILEMPNEIKINDVIIKTGNQYAVDKSETRIRAIQEQIKKEQLLNSQK